MVSYVGYVQLRELTQAVHGLASGCFLLVHPTGCAYGAGLTVYRVSRFQKDKQTQY
jgi:hypothetical protein